MTAVESGRGEVLRHRLERATSLGAHIGCAITIGLLLGTIGAVVLRYPIVHPEEEDTWVLYTIGGVLSAIALLLLYSGIHQIFASKTPETIVEIETLELQRGAKVRLFFRQPGPVQLESLRANLVGDEHWTVTVGSGSSRRTSHETKHLDTINFFDSGEVTATADAAYETMVTLNVPQHIKRSGPSNGRMTKWKIEVWGKVRGRADFMHPYDIEIV